MQYRFLFIGLLMLAVSACQTARGTREPVWPYPTPPSMPAPGAEPSPSPQHSPEYLPEPVLPPAGEPVFVPMQESRPPLPVFPKAAEQISSAAVVSLLRQARSATDMGNPEQAQSALERALRIEPRNYFVWSALAATHLERKSYTQAITVAKKSNSLARGNFYAELENYRVIVAAAEATGDAAAGLQAQARLDEIQRMLQSAPN